jgi:hypothetical protein
MAKYKVSFTVDDDRDDVDADLRGEVLGALANAFKTQMEQPINDLTVELVEPFIDRDATECTDCSGTGETFDFSVCKTCDGTGLQLEAYKRELTNLVGQLTPGQRKTFDRVYPAYPSLPVEKVREAIALCESCLASRGNKRKPDANP